MIFTLWRIGGDRILSIYTVHEEPNPVADRLDRAERLAFLRDGFSWPATLWTPFWLAKRRLWLALAAYAVAAAGLGYGVHLLGLGGGAVTIVVMAVHLIFGYEAYQLERWGYEQRGFSQIGTVTGRNKLECERRFFERWLPSQPVIASSRHDAGPLPAAGTLAASAGDMTERTVTAGKAPASRWRLFGPRTA